MSNRNTLSDCRRCQMYAHSIYLVCAVHPEGYLGHSCLDFALNQDLYEEEPWVPLGYVYQDDELIPDELVHLSQSDRVWMELNHPRVTGRCPDCGKEYRETPAVHWDCSVCGWIDDSVV